MSAGADFSGTCLKRKRPGSCGTCRWYDALGGICRNAASPRDWEFVDRREHFRRFEAGA